MQRTINPTDLWSFTAHVQLLIDTFNLCCIQINVSSLSTSLISAKWTKQLAAAITGLCASQDQRRTQQNLDWEPP